MFLAHRNVLSQHSSLQLCGCITLLNDVLCIELDSLCPVKCERDLELKAGAEAEHNEGSRQDHCESKLPQKTLKD